MSMLTGNPRSATVVAACEAVVFEISRADMEPLIKSRPEVARVLTEALVKRRSETERARNAPPPHPEEQRSFMQQTVGRILAFFGVNSKI